MTDKTVGAQEPSNINTAKYIYAADAAKNTKLGGHFVKEMEDNSPVKSEKIS